MHHRRRLDRDDLARRDEVDPGDGRSVESDQRRVRPANAALRDDDQSQRGRWPRSRCRLDPPRAGGESNHRPSRSNFLRRTIETHKRHTAKTDRSDRPQAIREFEIRRGPDADQRRSGGRILLENFEMAGALVEGEARTL